MSFRRPEKDVFSPFTFQPNFDVVWTSGIVVFSTSFQRVFAGWDVDPNMKSIFEFNNLRFSLEMFRHMSVIKDDC